MTYLLRNLTILVLAFNVLIFNNACNSSANSKDSDQAANTTPSNSDSRADNISPEAKLKAGGLYLTKNKDGVYSVSKILVIDNFSVHVRIYGDEFRAKPSRLSSTNLKVLIGHSPISAKGFLAENPELLTVEEVKEPELEGYKIYLEEMQK